MNHVEQLWLFFALVFGIMVLPGLDMAFVLGSTLAGGRRRGFAALAGVVAGGVCHVVMTALGISVLLELVLVHSTRCCWPARCTSPGSAFR